jgi:hypothetical protein
MLANLFQWIVRRPTPAYDQAFVEAVRVRQPVPPSPKVERLILVCWILIAIKHVLVIWTVHHYHVPFSQLWVNAPTWLFATLATVVYYAREA